MFVWDSCGTLGKALSLMVAEETVFEMDAAFERLIVVLKDTSASSM
jgi:hypothetical protein